jgi:hypothetical protein
VTMLARLQDPAGIHLVGSRDSLFADTLGIGRGGDHRDHACSEHHCAGSFRHIHCSRSCGRLTAGTGYYYRGHRLSVNFVTIRRLSGYDGLPQWTRAGLTQTWIGQIDQGRDRLGLDAHPNGLGVRPMVLIHGLCAARRLDTRQADAQLDRPAKANPAWQPPASIRCHRWKTLANLARRWRAPPDFDRDREAA